LGPLGTFLGWTPFVQSAIRKEARQGLGKFMQKVRKEQVNGL
jgi:hypothetical protein